jgi:predicted ester cyclase
MSTESNKARHQQFVDEVFNQGRLEAIADHVAADFVDHNKIPGLPPGPEGVRQAAAYLRSAFPDAQFSLESSIAEGDLVVTRAIMRGTHSGEFMGVSPTGRRIEVGEIDIVRYRDGKIVEHWVERDTLGLMQQLGMILAPRPAGL